MRAAARGPRRPAVGLCLVGLAAVLVAALAVVHARHFARLSLAAGAPALHNHGAAGAGAGSGAGAGAGADAAPPPSADFAPDTLARTWLRRARYETRGLLAVASSADRRKERQGTPEAGADALGGEAAQRRAGTEAAEAEMLRSQMLARLARHAVDARAEYERLGCGELGSANVAAAAARHAVAIEAAASGAGEPGGAAALGYALLFAPEGSDTSPAALAPLLAAIADAEAEESLFGTASASAVQAVSTGKSVGARAVAAAQPRPWRGQVPDRLKVPRMDVADAVFETQLARYERARVARAAARRDARAAWEDATADEEAAAVAAAGKRDLRGNSSGVRTAGLPARDEARKVAARRMSAPPSLVPAALLPPLPPPPQRWLPDLAPPVEMLRLPKWDIATLRLVDAFRLGRPLPAPGRDWSRPEALEDWRALRRRLVGLESAAAARAAAPPAPSPSRSPTPTNSSAAGNAPLAATSAGAVTGAADAGQVREPGPEPEPEPSWMTSDPRVRAAATRLVDESLSPPPPAAAVTRAAAALHAFAITNDYYTFTCEFLRSCLLNGIVPHIVGFDEEIAVEGHSGTHNYNWGLGKPLLWMRPPLVSLAAALGPHTLVLLADAHDSLVLAPGATIAARFRYLQGKRPGLRVLLSAERSCFPIDERECAGFPGPLEREAVPCGGGLYPNLNSGSMIGEAADVLAVLADVDAAFPQGLEAANMNDQAAMQYAYLDAERRERLGLGLDHTNQLFQAMHLSLDEVGALQVGASTAAPGAAAPPALRLCNRHTGGCPAVLHFNGGSKHAQVPIDDALFTSLLTTTELPPPPPPPPPAPAPAPLALAGAAPLSAADEAGGFVADEPSREAVAAADAQRLRPLREALDAYVVGGVRMTVRDFCCAAGWTSTGEAPREGVPPSRPGPVAQNHARPRWLQCG